MPEMGRGTTEMGRLAGSVLSAREQGPRKEPGFLNPYLFLRLETQSTRNPMF